MILKSLFSRTIFSRLSLMLFAVSLAACATRPVNKKIEGPVSNDNPFGQIEQEIKDNKTLALLAFSGGGTRAAAFSYGVLETLRDTRVRDERGETHRLLDHVDAITGVSGGSFTALSYRLYGDLLFDTYEHNFLKRNIQSELIAGVFNPLNWGDLLSDGWGRSEMAADIYDQVLFKGATFGDLKKTRGPLVIVSTTDIETGTRILFDTYDFNMLCTDLDGFRLARAAAASSAVPVILSPLTINNYSGSCGFKVPQWMTYYKNMKNLPRAVIKSRERIRSVEKLDSNSNPYLHLVDGGVSDNLGLRGVLDLFNLMEALREAGHKTRLDNVENIVVFVVNSLSDPQLGWNKREDGPGAISLMIQSAGVPIDHYSGEQVSELEDMASRWQHINQIKNTPEFKRLIKTHPNMQAAKFLEQTPNAKIYVINVAFSEIKDQEQRQYLYNLPTSFVLEPEQVDRLRSSAREIILNSLEFNRLISDLNARVIGQEGSSRSPLKFPN